MRNPFRSIPSYSRTIEWSLGFFGLATLGFGIIHTFTTFENIRIPSIFTIFSNAWGSPVSPVITWPIYAAAISLGCFQATWVYLSCRWPWHKPHGIHVLRWACLAGIILVAALANVFDFVDPYDRSRVSRYFIEPVFIQHLLIAPLLLIPLMSRRRADIALIIQALFFAIALFPCIARLIASCRDVIQNDHLPGYAELSLELFLAYTILTALPFLITCYGISHLINKNRFLIPDPNPDRIHCPKCSYNLTGSQNRPTCPECGIPVPPIPLK